MLQRIPVLNEQDTCCLLNPGALDAEVRSLGEHLAVSRDLLTALADPMRQDLVQLLARAELNVGEIAERVEVPYGTVHRWLTRFGLDDAALIRKALAGTDGAAQA